MSRQRCISLHARHQTNAAQPKLEGSEHVLICEVVARPLWMTKRILRTRFHRIPLLQKISNLPQIVTTRRIQVLAEIGIHPARTRLHVDLLGLRPARRGAALRLRRHVRILMRVRVPGRQKTVSRSQYERIEHKKRAQKPSAVTLCFDYSAPT